MQNTEGVYKVWNRMEIACAALKTLVSCAIRWCEICSEVRHCTNG